MKLHRPNQGYNFLGGRFNNINNEGYCLLGGSFSNKDNVRALIQFTRERQPHDI